VISSQLHPFLTDKLPDTSGQLRSSKCPCLHPSPVTFFSVILCLLAASRLPLSLKPDPQRHAHGGAPEAAEQSSRREHRVPHECHGLRREGALPWRGRVPGRPLPRLRHGELCLGSAHELCTPPPWARTQVSSASAAVGAHKRVLPPPRVQALRSSAASGSVRRLDRFGSSSVAPTGTDQALPRESSSSSSATVATTAAGPREEHRQRQVQPREQA
jgi:hypothetical protein